MKLKNSDMFSKFPTRAFTIIVLLLAQVFAGRMQAQTFEEARHLAFDGHRSQARQILKTILSKEFNSDAAILMARTYAWDEKPDSARLFLKQVMELYPDNPDALDACVDVEFWTKNWSKALQYCNTALRKDPSAEGFLFKKARILHSMGEYQESVATLEKLIEINPAHAEAMQKLLEYRPDVLRNAVKMTYTLDIFDQAFNRDPWQIGALSYGRKTKFGSVIARVNLASRNANQGFQGELDAYPKFGENNYGYLNYGFSQSAVFPKHRLGAEWYHNFPNSFEGSLGMRFLQFNDSHVSIYTATLGKYVGNYWLSLRSFITPGSEGVAVSALFQVRRYFSDPENYLGLRLGYGISPDDNRNLIDSNQTLALKTRSIRADFNHIFKHVWILNTGVVWGNEELPGGSFSGYYTFEVGLTRIF